MHLSKQIAKHLKELHFGGNWTCSDLQSVLSDVDWQMATAKISDLNTIVTLVFHINYYVASVASVLEGHELNSSDKLSFEHPPISSEQDWKKLLDKVFLDAKRFADLIEQLPENKMWMDFTDPKYGSYIRNLLGIVEHSHYHLGQIALIKKLIASQKAECQLNF